MTIDRYYYMYLDENKKIAYRNIYTAIVSFSPSVILDGIKQIEINEIVDGILLDNPQLFYLDLRGYTYYKTLSGVVLSFSYLATKDEIRLMKRKIEEKAQNILTSVDTKKMSDYQKEIYIHDYLCKNIQYDELCEKNSHLNVSAHTIWGVFLEQKAVCDGISKAFKYLCNAIGIKCIVVRGRAGSGNEENHAWNIVKIDDNPYQVDVTWDLNRYDGQLCTYHYFNLTDNLMLLDHQTRYDYPKCISNEYMYMKRENLLFYNRTDFVEHIKKSLLQRKKVVDYRLVLKNTSKSLEVIVDECFKEAVQKAYVSTVSAQIEHNHIQKCGRLKLNYIDKHTTASYGLKNTFNYDLLDGHAFEYFCADLLRYNGFDHVQVTSGSGDFGVDILCEYKGITYAIQCKCYSSTVGNKAVQEIFSGKSFYHCEKAVVITNNYFTSAAEESARHLKDVELWDRGRLNELYRIALSQGFVPNKY